MFGGKLGFSELLIVLVPAAFVIYVWGWSKIFSKAGHSPVLCLLMLIPFVNLITFVWFAFSTWPTHGNLPPGMYPKEVIRKLEGRPGA
jgi:hypothetical protein